MKYVAGKRTEKIPRLPLEGNLDLTYRCNNNCLHCWLRIAPNAPEKKAELTIDEIMRVVNEARALGCRRWIISGGEPMFRPDFAEIFDFVIGKSVSYTLNTNGALITPKIARLLTKKGVKLVALYGATAEVHDRITRNPGSFEATMRGMSYLKEAGAGFAVQIIPMKDSFHEYPAMVRLAESLSPSWRIGAAWLNLSACRDAGKNREIEAQRLDPPDAVEIDRPLPQFEEGDEDRTAAGCGPKTGEDRLFASCIGRRREFHVDPYGRMSFCCYIKDPALRFDLRKGSFADAWEKFIPSLADKVGGGEEYAKNCGACELREDCRWCPVFGYLEHGRYPAKVEYLCRIAKEARTFKDDWVKSHRRFYQIAGMTVQVESDLPIGGSTFHPKYREFEVRTPGEDRILIKHHFSLPDLEGKELGREVFRKGRIIVHKRPDVWIYLLLSTRPSPGDAYQAVIAFNNGFDRIRIFHRNDEAFRKGNLRTLSFLATDQVEKILSAAERMPEETPGFDLHSDKRRKVSDVLKCL